MHPEETIAAALELADRGLSAGEIAVRLGVARTSIRGWLRGKLPRGGGPREFALQPDALPDVYAYLLGVYLGDGCLTAHPRGVFKLRIFMDARYLGIIAECVEAIAAVRPGAVVNVYSKRVDRSVVISSYWKSWPVLFPQHGPGRKHHRRIALEPWQESLVDRYPGLLLRGLVHSDGCRSINTGRGGWRHARYSFSNRSADIRAIFCAACDRLDLRWTTAPHTVYVSRKADVAALDEFIGPKC